MKNYTTLPPSKAALSLGIAGYFPDYKNIPAVSLRLYLFG